MPINAKQACFPCTKLLTIPEFVGIFIMPLEFKLFNNFSLLKSFFSFFFKITKSHLTQRVDEDYILFDYKTYS